MFVGIGAPFLPLFSVFDMYLKLFKLKFSDFWLFCEDKQSHDNHKSLGGNTVSNSNGEFL